ncbi:MAG: Undecaprenyl-diphosphatase [Rhodospirillales bacterium]|nr:Undecaprenyl-diphosphatase [Rhodospirillales bacterium]
MHPDAILQAAFLGIVEGLTEFLPVSSTGHLILLVDLLGFQGPSGRVFEIAIQLGAILAVCVVYWRRLWHVARDAPSDPGARRFILAIVLGFLPAGVIGVLAGGFIKSVLFSPWVVSVSLIVGGIVILAVERVKPAPRFDKVERFPALLALGIGFCQALAMIPGVSRSGATIMGAMMLGVERRAAAEFSFFLAIPTMLGATVYDLYKNRATLSFDDGALIAVGFVLAFLAALIVVRALLAYISRHGFGVFAWYRIALGLVMLGVLSAR